MTRDKLWRVLFADAATEVAYHVALFTIATLITIIPDAGVVAGHSITAEEPHTD